MKFKPLGDYVLVSHTKEEEKTSGGIIIPDTAKEKPQEGKVIAAGPGRRIKDGNRIAVEVKKGDKVLFGKYAGTEIKLDGVDHIIMREDEIFCIL
jgi:chaperonin GroES